LSEGPILHMAGLGASCGWLLHSNGESHAGQARECQWAMQ
jgi:hypothetical protein